MYKQLQQAVLRDRLFSISLLLALVTSFIAIPQIGYIDWKVICCLFNLSIILLALDDLRVLDRVSIELLTSCHKQRSLSFILVALTFFSSMFITNDMALLTFVPLTLIIARKADFDPGFTVILQALGANIGSSLTPLGNPQNLFLFSYYHLTLAQFMLIMLPFALLGGLWLWLLNRRTINQPLNFKLESVQLESKRKIILYLLLFGVVFLSVLRVVDYRLVTVMVLLIVAVWDRQLLKRLDYCLLGTFICFFIIVGNLSHLNWLSNYLSQTCISSTGSYIGSILLSQLISNVPSAIFIAHFTQQWQAVLLGVNVGGLGTLIASMASVIAFRLYTREYSNQSYLSRFLFYNLISLLTFSLAMYYMVVQNPV
ncbi:MAG TPA: SLC13 family permease [Syntrophomonadaceae bacterium]|nr:SLC13 family permease [Syntrophomonadaceae bacterium]